MPLKLPTFQISYQNNIWLGDSPLERIDFYAHLGTNIKHLDYEANDTSQDQSKAVVFSEYLDPNSGTNNTIWVTSIKDYEGEANVHDWRTVITCVNVNRGNYFNTNLCLTGTTRKGTLAVGDWNYGSYIQFEYGDDAINLTTLRFDDNHETIYKYRNNFGRLPEEIISVKPNFIRITFDIIHQNFSATHEYCYAAVFMADPQNHSINYTDYINNLIEHYPNKKIKIDAYRRIHIETPQSISGYIAYSWYLESEETEIDLTNYYNENHLFLMNMSCETNRLDKYDFLTDVTNYKGNVRDSVSITTPVIRIQSDNTFPTKYNYCYFAPFNRYYYINDIIAVSDNIFDIYCECDVLMSFYDYIMNLEVIALRNEYDYNLSLEDSKLPVSTEIDCFTYNGLNYSDYDLEFLDLSNEGNDADDYNPAYSVVYATGEDNWVYAKYSDISVNSDWSIFNSAGLTVFLSGLRNMDSLQNMFKSEPSQAIINITLVPLYLTRYIHDNTGNNGKGYFEIHGGGDVYVAGSRISMDKDNKGYVWYNLHKGALDGTHSNSNLNSQTLNVTLDYRIYLKGSYIYKGVGHNSNVFSEYNFINYNYSKYILWLPYSGTIEIPSNYMIIALNSDVSYIDIEYKINISSGQSKIFVSLICDDNVKYIIKLIDCVIGFQIPLTFSNANETKRNILLSSISTVLGIAGLVAAPFTGGTTAIAGAGALSSGIAGFAQGTKASIVYRDNKGRFAGSFPVENLFGNVVEDKQPQKRTLNYGNVNKVANNILETLQNSVVNIRAEGSLGDGIVNAAFQFAHIELKYPKLYIYRNKIIEQSNYAFNVGRPSDYSGSLYGLYGYTEIGTVHIENIPNLMASEANDLESILRGGIIMPPKPTSLAIR